MDCSCPNDRIGENYIKAEKYGRRRKGNNMKSTTTIVVKDFQKEIKKMDKDDARLKIIRELEKHRERKDLGIRNYPESCMEKMLKDDQVHGI